MVIIFSCGLASHETQAQNSGSDFSSLKHTQSGRIDKVIDGLTVLLKDGKIIRLASLDIPDFTIWRDAPHAEAALTLLEKTLPEGTEVMIYQTRVAKKGRLTRMNHELGHIVTKKDKQWIQGLMLSEGLARVYTAPNAPEMSTQMLALEDQARRAQRGMWQATSDYRVLTPDEIVESKQSMGDFVIIEGVVAKVATVRNNIYLNFGQDWRKDFTIMVSPALRKQFAREGVPVMGLANTRVRVRGWVRDYNGPLIELEHLSHLEVFNPIATAVP